MSSVSIQDRAAVADRIHEFYALVDGGQASLTAALFTADAALTFGPGSPKPETLSGADAITVAMAARQAQTSAFTRHAVSNLTYAGEAGGIAVRYLLTLYRSDDESRDSRPAFVADVEELWQMTNGTWLIATRTILPAFFRS